MTDYIATEEFIYEAEKLGFTCKKVGFSLYIEDGNRPIANVSLYQPLQIDTRYDNLNYKNPAHLSLYKLINRLALTPLDKRKTEKRYRLRLDIDDKINIFDGGYRYLTKKDDYYCLSLAHLSGSWKDYQNTFTQAEIDEMGDVTRGFVKELANENL